MRFSEFKLLEQTQPKFYAIGDSHADMIARMGGKDWVNLAIGGTSSTDPRMLANISQIPKGATVLVSQGANDTANAMLRANQTKKPPKDPNQIAANVANVVDKVEAQGAKVIFMLFPNGPGRGKSPDAQWYGGSDYQDKVRAAIKSSINVPIIDINGKPLYDGIHAGNATYKEVADQVRAKAGDGVTLGPATTTPGAPATKDKFNQGASPSGALTTIDIPTSRKGPEIADIQKVLVALGYDLPKYGIDGIRGLETSTAIRSFQRDNNLKVDGDPGPETVGKLNSILKSKPELSKKLTKSTTSDVKSRVPDVALGNYKGNSSGGVGETGSAREAVKFFKSNGWSTAQAAGIVGNLQAESGANLKTDAVGDGGKAYGIAQWHPDRQANFKRAYGKDIRQAGFKEQLEFVQWELENTETRAAAMLRKAKTPEQAAWAFDEYYERSSGEHRQRRIDNALALAPKDTAVA
jgi:peptidoglycan hydrolase-like protein with peptidoglycan-binding domain